MPILPTTRSRPSIRPPSRASRALLVACLLGAGGLAQAQFFADADWKESDVPPPPSFDQDKLIPIDMPRYMTLKFGIDPATIKITGDGVVRYVVVATHGEGGGFNAFYEGLRCSTDEYRSYARFTNGKWDVSPAPEWKRFADRNSSYTRMLAQQGLCRGHAPRASVGEMVRSLKAPVREVE
ncbi:CNP1-like family protein [Variovorax sp. J22P168]|uniref:CNP1-like family protein n=1 Tax=Variovorax jilinensis TaxID=3053513 RepID=UPI002578B433|nr:CNP1-like family protein [Variovorax sp. J22P168]MDM0011458.1 CNP1-like family protein [Variovorax sp. J22P168]